MILGNDFRFQHAHDTDRQERIRHAENSGRTATSSLTFETTGVGSVILPVPLEFDATFLEKPSVTMGLELMRLADRSLYEFPHATSGVYRWVRDENDHYTGAYVWARVSCDPLLDANGQVLNQESVDLNPPNPRLRHHLVVAATAYKKLPGDVSSELKIPLR